MAIRFMLDTDNLTDLTGHAEILATYSDLVIDPQALRNRFPHSVLVFIDRGLGDPGDKASVFDIESGALTVAQAVAEYDRKLKAGVKYLTVYCSRDSLPGVDAAFGARRIFRWIATLDGTAHLLAFKALETPAAIQCLTAADLGYHADGSLVFEDAWHPTIDAGNAAAIQGEIHDASLRLQVALQDVTRLASSIGG